MTLEEGLTELERAIQQQARALYTETVIDHAMNPRNVGRLEDADGEARYKGPCGDTMVFWIESDGERVTKANFWTDGCGTAIASGSMTSTLAEGKTLHEAQDIGQREVLDGLGGLPPESEHCALLASRTLKMAIRDYLKSKGPS